TPEREAAWWASVPEARQFNAEIAAIEEDRDVDTSSRLARLRRTFRLEQHDADVLDLLIAVELDPAMARVCAYLQDDATLRYPSVSLASRLLGHGRTLRGLSPALLHWGLVTEHPQRAGEPPALLLDPGIASWLAGGAGHRAAAAHEESRPAP